MIGRRPDGRIEPAGARVARFDNVGDTPARFVAHYLLAQDTAELIRILPE